MRMIQAPTGFSLFLDVVFCATILCLAKTFGVSEDDCLFMTAAMSGFVVADTGYALEGLIRERRCCK